MKGRAKGFTVEKSGAAAGVANLPQGDGRSAGGNSAKLPLPQGEGRGEGKYEVSYSYDPSGRIKTLSWNAGGKSDSATYEYLENSHLLSSMKTGSGFATSYSYEDHRNVKTAVSNSFGLTAVSTYTYEYDELGRRKSVKNTGQAFTNPNFNIYGYNDRSEVTASNSFTGEDLASKNNPISDRSRSYNYDPIGNRKTAQEATINLSYTANSLNQYESISGGVNPETPTYDLDGNMTVSKGMVYTYNAENRLIEAAPQNPQQGSVKSTYIYDYMGRRARKTLYTWSSGSWQKQKDISFIYDGWNMVKESEKSSDSSPEVPTYYVWGLDLSQSMQGAGGVGGLAASVKSGNEYLYSYDGNGNVGQMVKASDGSIAAKYEYDPFGKTIFAEGPMASENPYRFSTKYLDDETGFYYYGYRYYAVEFGRWINRDPAEEDGGVNLYVLACNDPVVLIDILGEKTWGKGHVTGFTYTDNSPRYSDYTAWSGAKMKRKIYESTWVTPKATKKNPKPEPKERKQLVKVYYLANITASTYDNPSSMAVSKAIIDNGECPYGSKVIVDGIGWFIVEGYAGAGTSKEPRFDLWMALATRSEAFSMTRKVCVRCYPPGAPVDPSDRVKGPSDTWNYKEWTSDERLKVYREASKDLLDVITSKNKNWSWEGIYRDGELIK